MFDDIFEEEEMLLEEKYEYHTDSIPGVLPLVQFSGTLALPHEWDAAYGLNPKDDGSVIIQPQIRIPKRLYRYAQVLCAGQDESVLLNSMVKGLLLLGAHQMAVMIRERELLEEAAEHGHLTEEVLNGINKE